MELPLIDTDLKFFKVDGREYVLDIPSSSIFEVHSDLKPLLEESIDNTDTLYLKDLRSEYDLKDWMRYVGEIKHIIDNQYLTIYSSKIHPYNLREQDINSLTLNLNHQCNLECDYCYQRDPRFEKETGTMSQRIAEKCVDFLCKKSVGQDIFLNISGGEPLLEKDLVKYIIRYARNNEQKYDKNLEIKLSTNSLLLDEKLLDYLIEQDVKLIVTFNRIFDPQDYVWKAIYKKLELIKKSEINYQVKGLIHHLNLPDLDQLLEMYEREGYSELQLDKIISDDIDYQLSIEDTEELKEYYDRLLTRYEKREDFAQRINNLTFAVDCIACRKNQGYTCGAGKNYLAITPQGGVYPCHLLVGEDEFKLGSVDGNELDKEVRQQFYQPLHVLNREQCKDCWARYLCGGGCIGENYLTQGDLLTPYPPRCELNKYILKRAIEIYCRSLREGQKLNLDESRRRLPNELYKIDQCK